MIVKNELSLVWFPNDYEIKNYLKQFDKPLVFSKEIENLILFHYNKTLEKCKPIKLETKCPLCSSELKRQDFDNGGFRYVCPNWPRCKGFIMNQWDYNIAKNNGYKINKFSQEWIQNLLKDLESKNYHFTKNTIYRFLSQNNLDTPAKIERDMVRKFENREYNFGEGYNKARENSKEQELQIKEKLIGEYGWDNVKYQQFIFYKLKNDSKTYHKKPDFIIFRPDTSIMIVEAKLEDYYADKEQEQNYRTLLEFMFPNKMITFLYEFKEREKW